MSYDAYQCLKIRIDRGVCFATFDHPPINLVDVALMQEIDSLGRQVEADPSVQVVVFDPIGRQNVQRRFVDDGLDLRRQRRRGGRRRRARSGSRRLESARSCDSVTQRRARDAESSRRRQLRFAGQHRRHGIVQLRMFHRTHQGASSSSSSPARGFARGVGGGPFSSWSASFQRSRCSQNEWLSKCIWLLNAFPQTLHV